LAIGLWFALFLIDEGVNWVVSSFLGATVGVALTTIPCSVIWDVYVRIARGAPFRVGDLVEITDGPFSGQIGEVCKILEGTYTVAVRLLHAGDAAETHFFEWHQLRRIHRPAQRESS